MKQHNSLETTLERVGRILSHKYNITVRCRANECKTNGRTILLPALPDQISDSLWELIRGMLDHETAHILFSDFNGKMRNFRQKHGDFGFDLLNVIEDVRVNELMQKQYPGSRENILHSIDEITKKHPIGQFSLPVRFLCALFLAGSNLPYDQYGQDAVALVKQFENELKQFKSLKSTDAACEMAERILDKLQQLMKENERGKQHKQSSQSQQNDSEQESNEETSQSSPSSSQSSQEHDDGSEDQSSNPSNAADSTDEENDDSQQSASTNQNDSANETEDSAESTRQSQQDSSSSTSTDQSSNSSNEEGQQNPSQASSNEQRQLNNDGNENGSNGDQQSCSNSTGSVGANQQSGNNQNGQDGENNTNDMTDALSGKYDSTGNPFELQQSVQEHVQDEYGDSDNAIQPYRVYDPSQDKVITPRAMDNGQVYQQLSDSVRPHIGALRQQLIRTLRAKDTRFWIGDQEEGDINSKKLYALLNQGSHKVFRQIKACETDSVAVSLLIDLSGSMNGPRIQLARQVTILFAETLHQLRIPSEVIGFTTAPSKQAFAKLYRETGMALEDLSKLYARFFPCEYSIFKAFHEPFKALKPRVPAMNALDYTPIDGAILFAAKRIIIRSETRRIILVLTDGEPYTGNPILKHTVCNHLKENLRRCAHAGIECVAIGMQTEYVKQFFQDYVIVQDLPTLPKAFYTKFSELLRKPLK